MRLNKTELRIATLMRDIEGIPQGTQMRVRTDAESFFKKVDNGESFSIIHKDESVTEVPAEAIKVVGWTKNQK